LWGAIGFGVVSLIGGIMVEASSWSSMFLAYGVLQILTALVWFTFDFSVMATAGGDDDDDILSEEDALSSTGKYDSEEHHNNKGDLWETIRQPSTLLFFSMVTLAGALSGVVDTFLFVWLKELGGGETCMGAARLVMCAAEVPFFQASGYILDRLGTYGTLSLVGAAYSMRFTSLHILILSLILILILILFDEVLLLRSPIGALGGASCRGIFRL